MLSGLIKNKNLFIHLYEIDKNTAKHYRQLPVPIVEAPYISAITCASPGESLRMCRRSSLFSSAYVVEPKGVAKDWPEILNNDMTLTSALLDRLLSCGH